MAVTTNSALTGIAGGGAGAWGEITGTLADQSDLNTALGLKAPLDSPTFTTKTTHSYATASKVALFNSSKELITDSVIGYDATLHNITFTADAAGTNNGINFGNIHMATGVSNANILALRGPTDFVIDIKRPSDVAGCQIQCNTTASYFWALSPDNNKYAYIYCSNSQAALKSDLDLDIVTNGNTITAATFYRTGSAVLGKTAPATNATDGFVYVPASAGTPTGTPTSRAGFIPLCGDSSGNKLYAYLGGAWVDLTT